VSFGKGKGKGNHRRCQFGLELPPPRVVSHRKKRTAHPVRPRRLVPRPLCEAGARARDAAVCFRVAEHDEVGADADEGALAIDVNNGFQTSVFLPLF